MKASLLARDKGENLSKMMMLSLLRIKEKYKCLGKKIKINQLNLKKSGLSKKKGVRCVTKP